MRTERFRVFQYNQPGAGDPTRWIAAHTSDLADAAAGRRGWSPAGGEITPCPIPQDRKGLIQMGCDVVVKRGSHV